MTDQRVRKMAQVLAHYSLKLKDGDLFRIVGTPAAKPLMLALYAEALSVGANPYLATQIEETEELLYKHGSAAQIDYISPMARAEVEEIAATIRIMSSENTRLLSGADSTKIAARRKAMRFMLDRQMGRSAEGLLNWCVTLFPTQAAAQDADMSLAEYEDFVYAACKLNHDDPVAAWKATGSEQQRLADMLSTVDTIRLVAPGTDLTYQCAKRPWINCAGDRNFPDGEVFSSCVETSTNGYIRYSYPTIYAGREADDVRLTFANGRVTQATAGKGQELLDSLLAMDDGARVLGEVAFGTNYDITRFSRNILFDEKIGGTVHLALGAGYPETGSTNSSALHWDMICDMREGEAYADGKLIYKGGTFVV